MTDVILKQEYSYEDPRNLLAAKLRSNIYAFSGAKSLTEAMLLRDLLLDESDGLKSFSKFRQDVIQFNRLYNEAFLQAEYNNAVASAQSAMQWTQWKDDDWLEYSTVGDNRVRDAHRALDGLTLRASSPVWNRIYPPNGWNCRCNVRPASGKPLIEMSNEEAGKIALEVVPRGSYFDHNPGKTGLIFKNDHPYFLHAGKVMELDAVKHYGMREMSRILKGDHPSAVKFESVDEFNNWWGNMVTRHGINETDFSITDVQGASVVFDAHEKKAKYSYFKNHVLKKTEEKRHTYTSNVIDVLKNPDELWTRQKHNKQEWSYFKYYNDGAYMLKVVEDDGVPIAKTFFRIDDPDSAYISESRQGILLHRKK